MEFSISKSWWLLPILILNINGCSFLKTSNAPGDDAAHQPIIVIVGAGIGGSSCAYYLNKFLPEAEVTILEANNRIGKYNSIFRLIKIKNKVT